jgi:HEAT repeat protein/tRNA A-37 threonylcarbamoyl transferase component Bud32
MSFFADLRADRLIEEIRGIGDPMKPEAQKALAKLAKLGTGAIPKILDAVAVADKKETVAYVEILTQFVDNKTFADFAACLKEGNPRGVQAIAWALTSSRNYNPMLLLELLTQPDTPKAVVLDIINAQRARIPVRDMLNNAYTQEGNEKAALFRIIGEIADESALPDLLARVEGKDSMARMHIVNILSRFNKPEVSRALQNQLKDPNKLVRKAALNALTRMDGAVDIGPVCELMRDSDMEIQSKAVDVVIKARDPNTMKYLIEVLKDENEYARRAAVEVLNELGTAKDIKHLLSVIKDDDWWVRSRAADALGKIGGPRVVDAVLELIRDEDEEVRRAAIEILNQTKDERAVEQLIAATKDKDWWVSERAVDALAEIGSKRAVPALIEMIKSDNVRALPSVARALGKLGDTKVIDPLVQLLDRPEKEIKVEAMAALARLADDRRADALRGYIHAAGAGSSDLTVSQAAMRAIEDIDNRFSSTSVAAQAAAAQTHTGRVAAPEPSKTLLVEKADIGAFVKQAEEAQKMDVSTLKAGDMIEGRYKYIEKIGKGAFGTVVLVEDTVVEERLILKFLNPNVSQDEEMMKRFVHELRYSRKITHKNVIRIYDFLYMRGNYAISMEYFPSHTLGSEIVSEKPLDLKQAIQYGIDIATGMAVAHQAGIVHRDLKPANILIDDSHLLKIVDFGVAAAHKEGDTQLTKTGYVIGSPKYMAPEQILGKKVDERADVYSLGVILYEMLTGVPPYSRGDHMSVMYQHVQGKAKAAIEINRDLPQALSDLVSKAMAVDKTKRHQAMDEIRLELEKYR